MITNANPAIMAGRAIGTANLKKIDLFSKPKILPASIRVLD
tara:strand:+ start:385 stop:507 length:123 start_codon:yes stop_codon:yes gene_type:complete